MGDPVSLSECKTFSKKVVCGGIFRERVLLQTVPRESFPWEKRCVRKMARRFFHRVVEKRYGFEWRRRKNFKVGNFHRQGSRDDGNRAGCRVFSFVERFKKPLFLLWLRFFKKRKRYIRTKIEMEDGWTQRTFFTLS